MNVYPSMFKRLFCVQKDHMLINECLSSLATQPPINDLATDPGKSVTNDPGWCVANDPIGV